MTMALEVKTEKAYCNKCGMAYSKRRGNFPICYADTYKGLGTLPICKTCFDQMYSKYLNDCGEAKPAVRQMCRKLDLYWSDSIFDTVMLTATAATVMTKYLARINRSSYTGKSYDDTLIGEGTMWNFNVSPTVQVPDKLLESQSESQSNDEDDDEPVSEDISDFWGEGYTPSMYRKLEKRRQYWMSKFQDGTELDMGTEALIRQICALELDINRDRAEGKSVDKNINTLNNLLGSANLKPTQIKSDSTALNDIPFGVGIGWCEQFHPVPEPSDEFKDVDGIRKYVSVWLFGHLAKMLGKKNLYSRLYEEEVAKMRVERPEFVDEDDEEFVEDVLSSYDGDK